MGLKRRLVALFGTMLVAGCGDGAGPGPAPAFQVLAGQGTVAAGRFHTCVIDPQGRAWCWGDDVHGQLGDGAADPAPVAVPQLVAASVRFEKIAAGSEHTCAIAVGGALYCWGRNSSGQLGDNSTTARAAPVAVISAVGFTQVTAGRSHTCGRAADGRLFCWGDNNSGQLGDGTVTPSALPVQVTNAAGLVAVFAGAEHTCATGDGVTPPRCWGFNNVGQVGDGSDTSRAAPVAVTGGSAFGEMSGGRLHTCARSADGSSVHCWGENAGGQLGVSGPTSSSVPLVVGTIGALALDAGDDHACAVSLDAGLWCWGRNFAGQLGDASTVDRPTPVQAAPGLALVAVAAGGQHTCAVTSAAYLYCWGDNQRGQLGDGGLSARSVPAPVPPR